LLLEQRGHDVSPLAELLLFFADRAQHVHEVIRPALAAGRVVICDRFADSTTAYQGFGRGLPLDLIRTLAGAATQGLSPDVTVLLDVPAELGLRRARRRGLPDRMEEEERSFHERVGQGYRGLAAEEPKRWAVVDASASEADVASAVCAALSARGIEVPHAAR
jgi:dTMP kinase